MLTVGITGGIGSGKTALTDWLSTQGVAIVDADQAARKVVEPGQPALTEIARVFGDDALHADGTLNRASMRERVFRDPSLRKQLEDITHPRIREELSSNLSAATSAYAVLSSPLLLETQQAQMVDLIVVVDAPETTQIERTMARDNNTEDLVKEIMAAQMDRQTRLAKADIVIDNSGSLDDLLQQAQSLHHTLLARAAQC